MQADIAIPTRSVGLTIDNLDLNGNRCAGLKNFISDENGIYLRKGIRKIYSGKQGSTIVSYESRHVFLLLNPSNNTVTEINYRSGNGQEVLTNLPNYEITSFIEAGNGVIVFFQSRVPFVIAKDDAGNYTGQDLDIKGQGANKSFTGAIYYAQRLFFYTTNSTHIYYTDTLAVQSNTTELDIAGTFGVVGRLNKLFTMGYTAGYGAVSYMGAVFDTGDLLIFKGINPSDENNWAVTLKLKLNEFIYGDIINASTSAYVLSGKGIIDLGVAIQANSGDLGGSIISSKFKNTYDGTPQDSFWRDYNLCLFGNFLLLYNRGSETHYLYNFRTSGFSSIVGWNINSIAKIADILYICDGSNVYQAFSSNSDDGKPIVAEYITSEFDGGTSIQKLSRTVQINYKKSGNFRIYLNVHEGGNVNKGRQTILEAPNSNPVIRWSDVPTYKDWEEKLWVSATSNKFAKSKAHLKIRANSFTVRLLLESLNTSTSDGSLEFVINGLILTYQIEGN